MTNEELKNQIDLSALNSLTEEEKAVAINILKQYASTGNSEILDDLKYKDFDEIPVNIDTFLHDKKYLGKALYDADGRFTIFPYWEKVLKDIFPTNLTTKYNNIVFTGAIGLGKAQPLHSEVLTKTGFKKMKDLQLGEFVFGNDGKLHQIIGVFPQGVKPTCKVTFTDDTSTLCCDEHLWTVYNTKSKKWTTVETKQLMDGSRNLKHSKGHRYKIPITSPIEFESQNLIIPAYTLGVLLGDGAITTSVRFSSNDLEIVDNITKEILSGYEVRKNKAYLTYSICKIRNNTYYDKDKKAHIPTPNVYFEYIKQNNLNVKSENKFIPKEYLLNSVKNRVNLLQGLMDTDGYISKDGSIIEYTTTSEQLKNDFIWLVESLGGVCRVRVKYPSYRNKTGALIKGLRCYSIGIKLPKTISPFKLTRKKNRLSFKSFDPYRYIKDIEYIEDQECQCILLDSKEHLYLTNDFIVTHNSTIAVICLLYLLYRLLCLKDPYVYYGMQQIDKITISLMNITLENAKGVALDKMNQMILASDWFLAHGEMTGTTNLIYRPEKHIEIITASSNNQIIGRALFANFTDECNFALMANPEKQKTKMLKMVTQIDARMRSRFMRGTYLPTLNILASSKDTEQSFLEDYIKNKQENESKNTLIVDEPQWIVDNRKDSPVKFNVAIGNKFLANELLPLDITDSELASYRNKGYEIWKVPIGYLDTFQQNLDEAICSIIGIATASSLKYISGVKLNQTKTDSYVNPFVKDVITVGNAADDFVQYYQYFNLGLVNETDMSKPLFIHLDMSMTGDKTGIAGVWITGKEPNIKNLTDGDETTHEVTVADQTNNQQEISRDLHYKLAFSVSVQAPKGAQVSFAKNRNFIRWLRDKGFAIKSVSSDTFQSATLHQELTNDGFKTSIISVDRLAKDANGKPACLPYQFLKAAIYERHLTMYQKCDLLTNELVSLERKSDGHIDHPQNFSKDQADAVCGALWAASKFSEEFSYEYGDIIDTNFKANYDNRLAFKQQQIVDFEEELAKINLKSSTSSTDHNQNKEEDSNSILILEDGIFVL